MRIRKYQDKDFQSSSKESYGSFSPMFVILSVDKSRAIYTYKLGNIFTLRAIKGSFNRHELKISYLNWLEACKKIEITVEKIVKINNGVITYKTKYFDYDFVANESLIKK